MDKSLSFITLNVSSSNEFLSAELIGCSLAWIKFMATNIPSKEPTGLKACARFKRRVEVFSSPIDKM